MEMINRKNQEIIFITRVFVIIYDIEIMYLPHSALQIYIYFYVYHLPFQGGAAYKLKIDINNLQKRKDAL